MPHPSLLRILPLLLLGFFFSSCIDSKEEIWLNKNGSGRANLTLTVPNAVVALRGGKEGIARLVDKLLSQEASVSNVETTFTPSKKHTEIKVSFDFDSATKLYESLDKSAEDSEIPTAIQHIIGTTSIQRKGIGISGERKMDFGKAIPGISLLSAGGKNHQLVTIIHLPFMPSSHNATRSANNGSTLIWEVPLSDAMKRPHSQQISYQLSPTPIILGIAGGSLCIFLLYRSWRRKRHRTKLDELSIN